MELCSQNGFSKVQPCTAYQVTPVSRFTFPFRFYPLPLNFQNSSINHIAKKSTKNISFFIYLLQNPNPIQCFLPSSSFSFWLLSDSISFLLFGFCIGFPSPSETDSTKITTKTLSHLFKYYSSFHKKGLTIFC